MAGSNDTQLGPGERAEGGSMAAIGADSVLCWGLADREKLGERGGKAILWASVLPTWHGGSLGRQPQCATGQ